MGLAVSWPCSIQQFSGGHSVSGEKIEVMLWRTLWMRVRCSSLLWRFPRPSRTICQEEHERLRYRWKNRNCSFLMHWMSENGTYRISVRRRPCTWEEEPFDLIFEPFSGLANSLEVTVSCANDCLTHQGIRDHVYPLVHARTGKHIVSGSKNAYQLSPYGEGVWKRFVKVGVARFEPSIQRYIYPT